MLPKITDYWDTAQDAIPRFAADFSALSPADAKDATSAVRAAVAGHVQVLPDEVLLRAAFVVAEDLYRAACTIPAWDASVADYLDCSAATFFGLLSRRGYQLQYVIENCFDDLQRPTQEFPLWFRACGIAYVCPQLLAQELMQADGVAVSSCSASLADYIGEARYVGNQSVQECCEKGCHYVFLETDFQDGCLDYALRGRGAPGVLSVFRNEAPGPGTKAAVVLPDQTLGLEASYSALAEEALDLDLGVEVDRLFDDSSVPADGQPIAVIIAGGVCAGKTTVRKQKYSTGYVLIDAADIFLSLSRGEYFPFPEAFQEPMDLIGRLVARRALSEQRNIVTEIVGDELEPSQQLLDALKSSGYLVQGELITCDVEEAVRRNDSRGDDSISAYYAEPFQRAWIIDACNELAGSR